MDRSSRPGPPPPRLLGRFARRGRLRDGGRRLSAAPVGLRLRPRRGRRLCLLRHRARLRRRPRGDRGPGAPPRARLRLAPAATGPLVRPSRSCRRRRRVPTRSRTTPRPRRGRARSWPLRALCPSGRAGAASSYSRRSASGSSAASRKRSVKGVSMTPGQTQFARMPSGARSRARARVYCSSAPFDIV